MGMQSMWWIVKSHQYSNDFTVDKIDVYWRDDVHADVIVLWLICHVGSLCVKKNSNLFISTG